MKLAPPGQTGPNHQGQHYATSSKRQCRLEEGWKTLTPRWLPASLLPKTLGSTTRRFSRTRPNNASHDIIGVGWTRVISRRPRIRHSFPGVLACTSVEADTIVSPVVGAVSPNRSKARSGEGKEGEKRGKDGFHGAWFGMGLVCKTRTFCDLAGKV